MHIAPAQSYSRIIALAELIATLVSFIPILIGKFCPQWISSWFRWCPTSPQALELAEEEVLSYLKRPYSVQYVNIGPCWGKEDNFIWTLKMDPNKCHKKTPLVLIHGFASGIGLWVMNLDSLSSCRPVYAFDVLGFGRSSRPVFSTDALESECQFVICPLLVRKFRADLQKKFEKLIPNRKIIASYIYHCNAMYPSGEVAFRSMMDNSGWAKHPIITRINDLDKSVSMTFICGSRSWANSQPGLQIKYSRLSSFVDVQVIDCAGHHIYADRAEQFNALIFRICERWGGAEDSENGLPNS